MNNNKSFMTQVDLVTLQKEKTLEKITYKLLMTLFNKGNNNAYDIATSQNNGLVTIDDLSQSMFVFLLEHSEEWYLSRFRTQRIVTRKKVGMNEKWIECHDIISHQLIFLSDDTQKDFFRIVSNELYNNIRKHDRKKLWIELDNELIKIDDIPTLASHVCIDDVMTLSLYNQFTSYLLSVKPKKAQRYIDCMNLRLQGYKYKDISNKLDIKETTVKDTFSQLKELWKNFNK